MRLLVVTPSTVGAPATGHAYTCHDTRRAGSGQYSDEKARATASCVGTRCLAQKRSSSGSGMTPAADASGAQLVATHGMFLNCGH